jgi:signal transduction histidine kinase
LEVEDRPKATEYLERVEKALAGLHRLFEDVRLMTAQARLELQPCDLRALWREAWEQLESARENRDCALAEEADGLDLTCIGDPFRLVQMFRNLFDNALAAAPDPARIIVRAAVEIMNDHPAVTIDVADNGPGLNAEQRTTAFEPFVTTKPGGMGLGLALVRRIVEAHGGKVQAVDAAGGAVIRVTLLRGGWRGGRK